MDLNECKKELVAMRHVLANSIPRYPIGNNDDIDDDNYDNC